MSRAARAALAHLVGDYLLQTDWMATEKTKRWAPALAHAATYTAAHLVVTRDPWRLAIIGSTHAVIDRYRLARHAVWAKNQLAPKSFRSSWAESKATGYKPDRPDWLTVWLMIIADNTMHLIINSLALGGDPE